MSLKLQYTIVAVIILAALIWLVVRIVRMRNRNSCRCGDEESKPHACGGCALSDACKSPRKKL